MWFTVLLLLLSILAIFLYIPTNKRAPKYTWKLDMDDLVPLCSHWSIPYLAFFPFLALGYILLFFSEYATFFYLSIIFASIAGALFWYSYPNGINRPVINTHNFFSKLVQLIYKNDRATNTFPSSHVYLSLVTSYFLAAALPEFALLVWVIGILISLSTILIKQHHIIDILGGVLWATASIYLAILVIH